MRELKNEARISVLLYTGNALAIRSAQGRKLDPTQPDMQCLKSRYQGKEVPIIPGSSLKGVIRSRYEKIVSLFGGKCCNIFDRQNVCSNPKGWDKKTYEEKQKYVRQRICPACQLFGSQIIAARISIADAYPVGDCVLGERTGVGINRITGAAQDKALYDFEVVEDGKFQVEITLKNYELYQMKLLLYVLKDLNDGYVTLGSASTRGNGRMKVEEMEISLREYRKNVTGWRGAEDAQEIPLSGKYGKGYEWAQPFYGEIKLQECKIDEILDICKEVDIRNKVRRDMNV